MRRTVLTLGLALGLVAPLLGVARAQEPAPGLKAGFARADVTWHVAGAQGQYSATGNAVTTNKFDPYVHNWKTATSEGLHSPSYARAVVVEGADGTRVAYVGHDLYLQQDILTRRVAQLVEEADIGIDGDHLMIGASHNHSATYLASLAWGVWAFTDVGDYRMFDFLSKRIAQAVIDAAANLRPTRIGASVTRFDAVQQNILGPARADDGTPAGFPRDFFDDELAVVRLDDISDPDDPQPMGMLVNLGMHPESLSTVGMPSADFVGQVAKMVTRDTGADVVWSQGAVGDVEPDQSARANPPEERREYWHRDFAQMERMSRIVADAVVDTWADVEDNTPDVTERFVPFATDVPVAMADASFAGPASHPLPTVSNCRTSEAAGGRPGIPAVGLPDCERVDGPATPVYDLAQEHKIPVPANYGPTGYQAAQESTNAHLQVMRLGEIVLATCPCEPVSDMVMNFKSRANPEAGDIYDGFDWPCRPAGDDYECNYASATWRPDDWRPVSAALYDRMYAQIHNDAAGWDAEDPGSIASAEAEPDDPAAIKGNFTKEEIQALGADGYTLPLMVGQANDYVGYVVTYREHERGDHYRKALTAYGPHTADYINTRLVRMAAALKGGTGNATELLEAKALADPAANHAKARAFAEAAQAAVTAYEAALPDDGASPGIVALRDSSVPRFDAAQISWVGGSVYSDNPRVVVEKQAGEDWVPAAEQDGGEIVVNHLWHELDDPDVAVSWAVGDLPNGWQATWETFDQTPLGTYRFVIAGAFRSDREAREYSLVSDPFVVRPWAGITPLDGTFEGSSASFTVAPVQYPTTWEGAGRRVPYISQNTSDTATGTYCFRCTIRPWASGGEIVSAFVTVSHATGGQTSYPAVFDGTQWVATGLVVNDTDTVLVAPGDLSDQVGNINGGPLVLWEPPLDDGR